MSKVLDMRDHLFAKKNGGWWNGSVRCRACHHQWVEVKPGKIPAAASECSECHKAEGYAVSVDTIDMLRRALLSAERGEIVGAVVCMEGADDKSSVAYVAEDRIKMLGTLQWMGHIILHEGDL